MLSIYGQREKLKCSDIYCHYRDPKKILEQLSMQKSEYWLDAVSLLCIFLGKPLITILKKQQESNELLFDLQVFVLLRTLCYDGKSIQFDECHHRCFILSMHILLLRRSLVCWFLFPEQCSFISPFLATILQQQKSPVRLKFISVTISYHKNYILFFHFI